MEEGLHLCFESLDAAAMAVSSWSVELVGPTQRTSRALQNCRAVERDGTRNSCLAVHIWLLSVNASTCAFRVLLPVAYVVALRPVASNLEHKAVLARLREQHRRGAFLLRVKPGLWREGHGGRRWVEE